MRSSVLAASIDDTPQDVNLTPMLDVVFILLIFFIVVAAFIKEEGLDLNRADATSNPAPLSQSILIEIHENDEIRIDRRLVDPRAVRANVERLQGENPIATVVIQADRRSTNKTLVQVMDASRQAGVYDFSLAAHGD